MDKIRLDILKKALKLKIAVNDIDTLVEYQNYIKEHKIIIDIYLIDENINNQFNRFYIVRYKRKTYMFIYLYEFKLITQFKNMSYVEDNLQYIKSMFKNIIKSEKRIYLLKKII